MKQIIIDCANISSRDEFHAYMASKLDFPDYYGSNLDALHDLLCEITGELMLYVINAGRLMDKLDRYGAAILTVLRDSAEENPHLIVEIYY